MKENTTKENLKTKTESTEGPSKGTLDYLMLLARSFDIEKGEKKLLHSEFCLN